MIYLLYLQHLKLMFMGCLVGKYAIVPWIRHGNAWFLWCMSRQQRLDPQLLDAWNGLGEAGDPISRREWMTRIPYVFLMGCFWKT